MVDHRRACAFGDGVPSAQIRAAHASSPLSDRRGGQRDQRVDERELVMEFPNGVRLSRTNAIA